MIRATFDHWLKPTQLLEADEAQFTISVQNRFAQPPLGPRDPPRHQAGDQPPGPSPFSTRRRYCPCFFIGHRFASVSCLKIEIGFIQLL
jgi:hypothetical protein